MRRGFRALGAAALALAGSSCAAGHKANGFFRPEIGLSFISLDSGPRLSGRATAAAVVITPGIAVTAAHAANLVSGESIVGRSPRFDLLFFRTDRRHVLPAAEPRIGEDVVLYGDAAASGLRTASGTVAHLWPQVFSIRAEAGPGFSGGPVLDARTGQLVGIAYGYKDEPEGRVMYGYRIGAVMAEFASVQRLKAPGS